MDPSIFGTLLESALSPDERHRLGAHYTPRAYIERLIRPTIEEPLRADWDLVQAEALSLLGAEPDDAAKAKARAVIHAFHQKLANTTVLDPACGSGNFLYVAYDLLKRIEQEVLSRLYDLGETRQALQLDQVTVTPAHFLGIEIKPWAAAIAELVLWIGHLQWWRRLHPTGSPHEPVLQRYNNIQNRDAVLVWKAERATSRTRWDGRTFKVHPVTGNQVPDQNAQVPTVELVNPRKSDWPEADFIVGNPPFIGNKRMRDALGDGYVEALRATYPEVPDSVDFVLYWWHKAAEAVRSNQTERFGLITTNSLTQSFNRRVVYQHTTGKNPLKLLWAIPDHPWTDEGAAVRIGMTVGGLQGQSWLGFVTSEGNAATPEELAESVKVEGTTVDAIHEDLSSGAKAVGAPALISNSGMSCRGVIPVGKGFLVNTEQWLNWGRPPIIRTFRNGRDLTDEPRNSLIIDAFGLSETELRMRFPGPYQHLLETVKPERDQKQRAGHRDRWWVFGEPRATFRPALVGLSRYIVTPQVAKYRVFQFLSGEILPDDKLIAIASEDAEMLGVLESRIHKSWASANRGNMGVGNDPVYNKTSCFDTFPFPEPTDRQKALIRDLADRLDAHRKAAQGRGVTITGMYNLLAKLRAGQAFTQQERIQHEAAQTEILRQLHDELDVAVADAYGWPVDLGESEVLVRLVALNRERAAEETRGVVRWLRPEYQAPQETQAVRTPVLDLEIDTEVVASGPATQHWPKDLKDQLAALRTLLLSTERLWTLEGVAAAFKSRGRYREGIETQLDLLADLRVLERIDTPQGPRWHRPQAMGA